MALPSIFDVNVAQQLISRIHKLHADMHPQWGKMTATQMLAHCSVTYEMIYTNKHPRPNIFMRWILKMFVKNLVVSEKPYKKNSPTAPAFLIKDQRQFDHEKKRLIEFLERTQKEGPSFFTHKESNSFGVLTV